MQDVVYAVAAIGGFVAFLGILMWAGMRAKKKGKVDKHWQDY